MFFVDGDLTNVSLADVIGGGAHFTLSRQTVNVGSPALTGARLNTFTLSSLQLSSAFGLSITGGSISLVSLLPSVADVAAGDGRKWSAISVSGLSGSLSLGGVISGDRHRTLAVKVNCASGALNATTATPLDWTNEVPAAGIALASNELFFVDGDLTNVSLADVVGGGAHFTLSRQTVSVGSPALTGARLNTFTLSNLQLSSAFGLSITGGSISLVSLLPSVADVAAGDGRKWSAISVTGLSGSLALGGVISATVSNLVVKVNSASGALNATTATPLDWTNQVPAAGITLASNELFFVDGDLTNVSLADVVGGGAHFTLSRQTVSVGSPALTGARLNTFTLSSLQLSSAFGLSITGGSISLVSLLPSVADVAAGDGRKWSAISVSGLSGSLALGGVISATVTGLTVKVNSASGALNATTATPLDWTNEVPAAGIALASNELFFVDGDLTNVSLADVIGGGAHFTLTVRP